MYMSTSRTSLNYFPLTVCTFSVDSMLVLVAKIQEPYVPYLIQYSAIQQIELMNGIEAMNLVSVLLLPSFMSGVTPGFLPTGG